MSETPNSSPESRVENGQQAESQPKDPSKSLIIKGVSSRIRDVARNGREELEKALDDEAKMRKIAEEIFYDAMGAGELDLSTSVDVLVKNAIQSASLKKTILGEVSMRSSYESSIQAIISKRYTPTPEQLTKISRLLQGAELSDLQRSASSLVKTIEWLRRYEGTLGQVNTKEEGAVMTESGLEGAGLSGDPDAQYIVAQYRRYGKVSEKILGPFLQKIHTQPENIRAQFIEYFLPTASLQTMMNLGVMTRDEAKTALAQAVGVIHASFDPRNNPKDDEWLDESLTGKASEYFVSTHLYHDKLQHTIADPRLEKALTDRLSSGSPDTISTLDELRFRLTRLRLPNGQPLIADPEQIKEGHAITLQVPGVGGEWVTYTHHIRAMEVTDPGDTASLRKGCMVVSNQTDLRFPTKEYFVSYDGLFHMLEDQATRMSDAAINGGQPSYISIGTNPSQVEQNPVTEAMFLRDLDRLDPDGAGKGFAVGMHLWMNAGAKKDETKIIARVEKHVNGEIQLHDETNNQGPVKISYEKLLNLLESEEVSIRRVGDLSNNPSLLVSQMTSIGVDNLKVHDNKICLDHGPAPVSTGHGHGDHGSDHGAHHGSEYHEDHPEVKVFRKSEKEWIMVEWQRDGRVKVQKYLGKGVWGKDEHGKPKLIESEKDLPDDTAHDHSISEKKRIKARKKFLKKNWKPRHQLTKPKEMTRAQLLSYIDENGYKQASSEDPVSRLNAEIAASERELHHVDKGWLMNLAGTDGTSIGNIIGAGKAMWHMFTHLMEENEKSREVRALYYYCRRAYGPSHPLTAHALMHFSQTIGKSINSKKDELAKGLQGEVKRTELLHLAQDTSRKASDIEWFLAALLVAGSEGDLYADYPLAAHQGEYLWFRQLVRKLGYNVEEEEPKFRALALDKQEKSDGQPSEHQMITLFLKSKQAENPYIQAIGGGGDFWKGAIEGGKASNTEKGKRESGQISNGGKRAEYVESKMATNEMAIAVGAMSNVFEKDSTAGNLAFAFALPMSNLVASGSLDSDMKNKIHGFFYGTVPFHALAFVRAKTTVYQDTVDMVVSRLVQDSRLPASAKEEMENIKRLRAVGFSENKELHKAIYKFWKKYYTVLHPVLQLQDPLLQTIVSDDTASSHDRQTAQEYFDRLGTEVGYHKTTNKDTFTYEGYNCGSGSMMYTEKDAGGYKLQSLDQILDQIPFTYDGDMTGNGNATKAVFQSMLWENQVIAFMTMIRDNATFRQAENGDLQKAQAILAYEEIISWINRIYVGEVKQGKFKSLLKDKEFFIHGLTKARLLPDLSAESASTRVEQMFGSPADRSQLATDLANQFILNPSSVSTVQQRVQENTAAKIGGRESY